MLYTYSIFGKYLQVDNVDEIFIRIRICAHSAWTAYSAYAWPTLVYVLSGPWFLAGGSSSLLALLRLGKIPKKSENSKKKIRIYRSQEVRNTVISFGEISLTMFEKYRKRRGDPDFFRQHCCLSIHKSKLQWDEQACLDFLWQERTQCRNCVSRSWIKNFQFCMSIWCNSIWLCVEAHRRKVPDLGSISLFSIHEQSVWSVSQFKRAVKRSSGAGWKYEAVPSWNFQHETHRNASPSNISIVIQVYVN